MNSHETQPGKTQPDFSYHHGRYFAVTDSFARSIAAVQALLGGTGCDLLVAGNQDTINLGLAFLTGVVLDILSGSLMGLHALSLVVMVFLVQHFRSRLRFFPPWQQAFSVFVLLVNDRIILIWITALLGEPLPTWKYWLPPLVGMVLWPWLFLLLDRMRAMSRQHKS